MKVLSVAKARQVPDNVLVRFKEGLIKDQGPGRGHYGHVGRPGRQGGSLPGHAGRCYASAAKWVLENQGNENVWLAHGMATGTGGEIEGQEYGHAWVEIGPMVLDTESGWIGSRGVFYSAGQVHDVTRYSRDQLLENLVEFETWGPWGE